MTGPTIVVCQDCGHLIEPVYVRSGRDVYEITLCQRDECLMERITADRPSWWNTPDEDPAAVMRRARLMFDYQLWLRARSTMIVDPKVLFRVTGV